MDSNLLTVTLRAEQQMCPMTFDMFDVLTGTEAEPRRLENKEAGCIEKHVSVWRDSVVDY